MRNEFLARTDPNGSSHLGVLLQPGIWRAARFGEPIDVSSNGIENPFLLPCVRAARQPRRGSSLLEESRQQTALERLDVRHCDVGQLKWQQIVDVSTAADGERCSSGERLRRFEAA
jgi:hypothetical protein